MDGLIDLPTILENTRVVTVWLLALEQELRHRMWLEYPVLMLAVSAIAAYSLLRRLSRNAKTVHRRG